MTIYNTADTRDMIKLSHDYSESWIRKCASVMGKPTGMKVKEIPAKSCDFQTGDVCPECGSIEYYTSGTCKTCRTCGFAGGCG